MVPARAFTAPEEFAGRREVAEPCAAIVVDEGFGFLIDDRADGSGGRIDAEDAEDLMAALIVAEEEGRAVREPEEVRDVEGIGEEGFVERDFAEAAEVEQVGPELVDGVAWLIVGDLDEFRLFLVLRRGFDDGDDAVLALAFPESDHPAAVRRDEAGIGEVELRGGTGGEGGFRAVLGFGEEVAIAQEDFGGRLPCGRGRGSRSVAAARARIRCQAVDGESDHVGFRGGRGEEGAILAGEAPDVLGKGVLVAGFARLEFAVFRALSAAVDPDDREWFRGLVFESDGRFRSIRSRAEAASEGEAAGRFLRLVSAQRFCFARGGVELPAASEGRGADDARGIALDGGERKVFRLGLRGTGGAEGCGQCFVIAEEGALSGSGIDPDEFVPSRCRFETVREGLAVAGPLGIDAVAEDLSVEAFVEFLRHFVIGAGTLGRGRGGCAGSGDEEKEERPAEHGGDHGRGWSAHLV